MSQDRLQTALQRVTDEVTRSAATLIREGRTVSLNQVVSGRTPRSPDIRGPLRTLTLGLPVAPSGLTVVHEYVMLSTHCGTHIDSLGHVAWDGSFNGGRGSDELTLGGFRSLGVEHYPPVLTRGVLIDVRPEDDRVRQRDIEAAATSCGGLSSGDAVLLYFGPPAQDGSETAATRDTRLTPEAAAWLDDQGVCLVGCEFSLEGQTPLADAMPAHRALLFDRSVPIVEGLELAELVAAQRSTFALYVGPIPLARASGTWVSAAAIL